MEPDWPVAGVKRPRFRRACRLASNTRGIVHSAGFLHPASRGRLRGPLRPAPLPRMYLSVSKIGACDAIRGLIEAILLEPDGERLKITLKGNLAGMLQAARDSKRSPDTGDLLVQIQLVAGACCRRYLQLWSGTA